MRIRPRLQYDPIVPITLTPQEVRGVLKGTVTQLRRLAVLPTERGAWEATTIGGIGCATSAGAPVAEQGAIWNTKTGTTIAAPWGAGQRLWVRETWRAEEREGDGVDGIRFAAGDVFVAIEDTRDAADRWLDAYHMKPSGKRWRPPAHMPQWASRLSLEITGVRVEPLFAISDEDARASGAHPLPLQEVTRGAWWTADTTAGAGLHARTPAAAFRRLWRSLHGADSWNANAWVWVLEVRKVKGPQ